MTIRHLRIFVEVAQRQNMTSAATHLYLSQSTVSQAIRELEEHYDTLLFDRLSKRLYITPAGRHLLSYAQPLLGSFDELEQQMCKESRTEHLRIGSTLTIASCLMPQLLHSLGTNCPNTCLFSLTGNTQTIEQKLLQNDLDVGIVEGEIQSSDLLAFPILDDFLVLTCSTAHPLANRHTIAFQDLAEYPFVMREKGSGTRELFERSAIPNGLRLQIKVEASFPEAMKSAIRINNCLGVLSIRLLEEELLGGSVRIFRNNWGAWNRTFKLVYHKDKWLTPSIHMLSSLLKQYKRPQCTEQFDIGTLTL